VEKSFSFRNYRGYRPYTARAISKNATKCIGYCVSSAAAGDNDCILMPSTDSLIHIVLVFSVYETARMTAGACRPEIYGRWKDAPSNEQRPRWRKCLLHVEAVTSVAAVVVIAMDYS